MTEQELQLFVKAIVPAVRDLVAQAVAPLTGRLAALEALPPPRDGRDGLPGPPGRDGLDGLAGAPGADGAAGLDGLGLDGLSAAYDGARTLTLSLAAGDRTQAYTLTLPVPLYQGVWQKHLTYVRGDLVTFGGSLWHANHDPAPEAKPGDGSTTWQLAVKRGQDGKA